MDRFPLVAPSALARPLGRRGAFAPDVLLRDGDALVIRAPRLLRAEIRVLADEVADIVADPGGTRAGGDELRFPAGGGVAARIFHLGRRTGSRLAVLRGPEPPNLAIVLREPQVLPLRRRLPFAPAGIAVTVRDLDGAAAALGARWAHRVRVPEDPIVAGVGRVVSRADAALRLGCVAAGAGGGSYAMRELLEGQWPLAAAGALVTAACWLVLTSVRRRQTVAAP